MIALYPGYKSLQQRNMQQAITYEEAKRRGKEKRLAEKRIRTLEDRVKKLEEQIQKLLDISVSES